MFLSEGAVTNKTGGKNVNLAHIHIRMVRLGVELSQCSATVYTTIHGVTCQKTYPLISILSDLHAYRQCAMTKKRSLAIGVNDGARDFPSATIVPASSLFWVRQPAQSACH